MKYLRYFETESEYQAISGSLVTPNVSYTKDDDFVHLKPLSIKTLTVAELIEEGYATNNSGRIQISSACPYTMYQISDFIEVLTNNKQITSGTNNSFEWTQALPNGWTAQELANIYTNNTMNFGIATMAGDWNAMPKFNGVDFTGVDSMKLTYGQGNSWGVIGQPIFHTYAPLNVTVELGGNYSSVMSRPFQYMDTTQHFTLKCPYLWAHTTSGVFEYAYQLRDITFDGVWDWSQCRNVTNMFHWCKYLEEIPLGNSSQDRDGSQNTIYARYDGVRGTASLDQMFCACLNLKKINPTFNFNATTFADVAPYNGGLGAFNACNSLTDIRIKNLNNCDWDFESSACPLNNIDVDSINYILNNVSENVSLRYAITNSLSVDYGTNSDGSSKTYYNYDNGAKLYWTDSSKTGYTVTTATDYPVTVSDTNFSVNFSTLYQSEVSQDAIDAAKAKGWIVKFGGTTV